MALIREARCDHSPSADPAVIVFRANQNVPPAG